MTKQRSPQKQTLVALVENKPGVLNRVASLFRRRNFNVDSLTVGRTHSHISRMTIVVDAANDAHLMAANLFKLVNVIDVNLVSNEPHVSRDLALIKVRTDDIESRNTDHHLRTLSGAYHRHWHRSRHYRDHRSKKIVEDMIEELPPLGIVELVRTGVVAMGRGIRILNISQ